MVMTVIRVATPIIRPDNSEHRAQLMRLQRGEALRLRCRCSVAFQIKVKRAYTSYRRGRCSLRVRVLCAGPVTAISSPEATAFTDTPFDLMILSASVTEDTNRA